MDITNLIKVCKEKNIKSYPALIFIAAKAVNNNENLRYSYDKDGNMGCWQELVCGYPIFDDESKTYSYIYTPHSDDFTTYYESWIGDSEKYTAGRGMYLTEIPENSFTVSCIPWVSYTAMNLNIRTEGNYLLPIITWGRYFVQGNRILLPLTLQIHHAVADGYHASLFFKDFENMAAEFLKS